MEPSTATSERPRADRRALSERTVCGALQETSADHRNRVAIRTKGDQVSFTWGLYAECVRATAAKQHGIADDSPAALAGEEAVLTEVQRGIDAANESLARVEQIKRFKVLPADWEPGGDELTPTMKLKRKPIAEKYGAEIEALYAE
jgi:long-subunit acyl-CoA synthetase (AMP-forming)